MEALFRKPFPDSNQITLPVTPKPESNGERTIANNSARPKLLDDLEGLAQNSEKELRSEKLKDSRAKPALIEAVRPSRRPTRATRASEPIYLDPDEAAPGEPHVPKYSLEHGLGPPWERQVAINAPSTIN